MEISAVVSYRNSTSNHNGLVFLLVLCTVVSYRNSTSNHNSFALRKAIRALYLIEILHQTTTLVLTILLCSCCILSKFYIKPQLLELHRHDGRRCILSKFYIKPQLARQWLMVPCGCILSKFYIKPQPGRLPGFHHIVVSYRNSTSNHNFGKGCSSPLRLYLIEILHQTTTCGRQRVPQKSLYLIEILHQTTTGT